MHQAIKAVQSTQIQKAMNKKIILFCTVLICVLAACNHSGKTESKTNDSNKTVAVYQCPMDCEHGKTYDKPGKCPVCEMDLEKK